MSLGFQPLCGGTLAGRLVVSSGRGSGVKSPESDHVVLNGLRGGGVALEGLPACAARVGLRSNQIPVSPISMEGTEMAIGWLWISK